MVGLIVGIIMIIIIIGVTICGIEVNKKMEKEEKEKEERLIAIEEKILIAKEEENKKLEQEEKQRYATVLKVKYLKELNNSMLKDIFEKDLEMFTNDTEKLLENITQKEKTFSQKDTIIYLAKLNQLSLRGESLSGTLPTCLRTRFIVLKSLDSFDKKVLDKYYWYDVDKVKIFDYATTTELDEEVSKTEQLLNKLVEITEQTFTDTVAKLLLVKEELEKKLNNITEDCKD